MNTLDAVMEVLGELHPENVDLAAVTVTGEGVAVEIILVPQKEPAGQGKRNSEEGR